jgi:hypothetical protein
LRRDVDEEHRAPVEPLQQQTAEERPEADADGGEGGPDADRLRTLLAGEDVRDDRQRRGHDQRAADAHRGADGDQLARGVDEEYSEARPAEGQEAELERPPAAEPVAEGAHRQQQAGEGEQVGVDHWRVEPEAWNSSCRLGRATPFARDAHPLDYPIAA